MRMKNNYTVQFADFCKQNDLMMNCADCADCVTLLNIAQLKISLNFEKFRFIK